MASYSKFLGRNVTVQYRAGDILLPASGTFVGDSGRSIFLEQHLEQRGKRNYFRWEIPYQCINRLEEAPEPNVEKVPQAEMSDASDLPEARSAAAAASQGTSNPASIFSLPQRPKAV